MRGLQWYWLMPGAILLVMATRLLSAPLAAAAVVLVVVAAALLTLGHRARVERKVAMLVASRDDDVGGGMPGWSGSWER